jgi:transposase
LDLGVGYRFISADRDQVFLLPPDVRDWLPEQDLAWAVLDAVEQFDLSAFRAVYRADGLSRPAYDPALMVAVLLFAYCDGVRSSRQIERRCQRDVGFRVITGNLFPDHATIARFRRRHHRALAGLFTQVLRLLAEAGMVRVGLVALDGTRMKSNASSRANRTGAQLNDDITDVVARMMAEAEATDAAEDAAHGDRRGDEPPDGMGSRADRLGRLREARARMAARAQAAQQQQDERIRRYDQARAAGTPVPGPRPGPRPPQNDRSERINVTDPDSRIVKTRHGWAQGYNGQIVVGADQVIIGADIAQSSDDSGALHPMLKHARDELDQVGVSDRIQALLADSGYGGKTNLSEPAEPILLIATKSGRKKTDTGAPRHPAVARMASRMSTNAGQALFSRRAWMVEPVFGQIKQRLGADLKHRGIDMITSEWRLIAASHNLLKYWRYTTRTAETG